MAKSGLDFFPLDVEMDINVKLIEAEYGLKGFGVIVKLYQEIYKERGYYLEYTYEVALLFSQKIGLGVSAVSEIINSAINRGIFDKTLYEKYRILTSRGVQKRYFEAIGRRKNVEVKSEYLIIPSSEIPSNVRILRENVNNFEENAGISKQKKREEKKVKEREARTHTLTREETSLLNNYSINVDVTEVAEGTDIKLLAEKVMASPYLKQWKFLSKYLKYYDKIISGYYDAYDAEKRATIDKTGESYQRHQYSEKEINKAFISFN